LSENFCYRCPGTFFSNRCCGTQHVDANNSIHFSNNGQCPVGYTLTIKSTGYESGDNTARDSDKSETKAGENYVDQNKVRLERKFINERIEKFKYCDNKMYSKKDCEHTLEIYKERLRLLDSDPEYYFYKMSKK
jgi:hypothetical protein